MGDPPGGKQPGGPFAGYEDRECGDHRPGLDRAWCLGCSEWCFPGSAAKDGCKGCRVVALQARIDKALGICSKDWRWCNGTQKIATGLIVSALTGTENGDE
jgi:hypothetical protein